METKKRSFRVEIETPKDDNAKTISYHREALIYDDEGNIAGKSLQRPQSFTYRFIDEATRTITFHDPVLDIETTVSIAGIANAIRRDFEYLKDLEENPPPEPEEEESDEEFVIEE